MPAPHPPARAQTIKQAKASYKARGRPSLSEAETKKLERAAELDRRAWRIQEAEKRREEAARKRVEKEKRERDELARAPLGSQRRIDRFGYKSSQMHLGAFLSRPDAKAAEQKENVNVKILDEDDEFGDADVDDATLLNTLDGTAEQRTTRTTAKARSPSSFTTAHALLPLADAVKSRTPLAVEFGDGSLEEFFDELGSGTQIARELEVDQPVEAPSQSTCVSAAGANPDELNLDDFDLTEEDLEELDSISALRVSKQEDRTLMPPPPLPTKNYVPMAVVPPILSPGFTMSQLEHFIDDDLQLTQAVPD